MRLRAGLAALLVATTAVAAGCGEDSQDRDVDPAALLDAALSKPVPSAQATLETELAPDGGPFDPATATLTGPFVTGDGRSLPQLAWDLEAKVVGFGVSGKLVSTGDNAYVVFFGENYEVGEQPVARINRRIRRATSGGTAGPLSGIGLDPRRWFVDPQYEGTEDVDGAETDHVTANVDGAQLMADFQRLARILEIPAGLTGMLGSGNPEGTVDAWVATEDETLRKLSGEILLDMPPGLQALGAETGTLNFTLELADVGGSFQVEQPPGGGFQPIGQLIEQIRRFTGFNL